MQVPDIQQSDRPLPVPGVRVQQNLNPDAFGASIANEVRRQDEIDEDRADQAAVSAAMVKARGRYRERMYGKGGLFYQTGPDLFKAAESAPVEFDTELSGIEGELGNDRQREAFGLQRNALHTEFSDSLTRRTGVEVRRFQADTLDASLTEAADLAITRAAHGDVSLLPDGRVDTKLVEAAVHEQAGLIDIYAEDHEGELPLDRAQWSSLKIKEAMSSTHAGAIDQIRARGDDLLAKQYFEQVKDDLLPRERERLQNDVRRSSIAGEAERASKATFAVHWDEQAALTRTGPSIAEMRAAGHAEIDAITDQDVQDQARSRFDARMDRAERTLVETRGAHYDALDAVLMDNAGDLSKAQNDARWNSLDARQHEALIKRSQQITGGDLVVNDNPTYYGLLREATDPRTAAKFADRVLLEQATTLDSQHLDRLVSLQVAVRQSLGRGGERGSDEDAKAAEKLLNTARTHWNVMQSFADQVDTNITAKPRNDFLAVYDEAVVAAQVGKGAELTSTEYQTIGQNLLLDFEIDRAWDDPLDDVDTQVWKLNIGDITIEDVPQAQRDAITDVLLEQGQVVDEQRIRAEYLRGLRLQGIQ